MRNYLLYALPLLLLVIHTNNQPCGQKFFFETDPANAQARQEIAQNMVAYYQSHFPHENSSSTAMQHQAIILAVTKTMNNPAGD